MSALGIQVPRRAAVDFYLHARPAPMPGVTGMSLEPGRGCAGVLPLTHRTYACMVYTDAWNLDVHPAGLPCFRDVASNEAVKAYLLRMLPRVVVSGGTRLGWIEEGMAAYLQGPAFDGQDLDLWARAALESGAARSISALLACDFAVGAWSEADRIVFDLVIIRQLGSFWRFWNQTQGMDAFRAFYRRRYRPAWDWLRARGRPTEPFESVFGVGLREAQATWLSYLTRADTPLPDAVTEVVERAAKEVPDCRWSGIAIGRDGDSRRPASTAP